MDSSASRLQGVRPRARLERRTQRTALFSPDPSSLASNARWCAASPGTATAWPRSWVGAGHGQDDRLGRRPRRLAAVRRARPRLCASRAAPPGSSSTRQACDRTSVAAISSRASTARAGHRADRRRGRHARHPRARPAARARDGRGGKLVARRRHHASCPSIRAGGALGALATRLDPIELRREPPPARDVGTRGRRNAPQPGRRTRARPLRTPRPAPRPAATTTKVVTSTCSPTGTPTDDPDGSVMIAHYRADVAELNGRARALMRADGQLGSDEVSAAGRTFASGDRVLVKRNDRRCDVRNGDRGVVEARRCSPPARSRPLRRPARSNSTLASSRGRPTTAARPRARLRAHRLRRPGPHLPPRARPRTRRGLQRVDLHDHDPRQRCEPALRRRRTRPRPRRVRSRRASTRRTSPPRRRAHPSRADELAIDRLLPAERRTRARPLSSRSRASPLARTAHPAPARTAPSRAQLELGHGRARPD